MISLEVRSIRGNSTIEVKPAAVVIAGWTGRDGEALEAHIRELEELGVARPKSVPMFYRVDAALLTAERHLQMVGRDASGEVEAVLWKHAGQLYVGVGSDHTDRKLEAVGVTLSKQLCGKPVSAAVWPWHEVADHWDRVMLRSHLPLSGETYQEGLAGKLRRPDELLALYEQRVGKMLDGTVMFCGTLPVRGAIRFAKAMSLELVDPVLARSLTHRYDVEPLPIAEA